MWLLEAWAPGPRKLVQFLIQPSTSCVGLDMLPNFSGLHQLSMCDNSTSFGGLLRGVYELIWGRAANGA